MRRRKRGFGIGKVPLSHTHTHTYLFSERINIAELKARVWVAVVFHFAGCVEYIVSYVYLSPLPRRAIAVARQREIERRKKDVVCQHCLNLID